MLVEFGTPGTVEHVALHMRATDREEIFAVFPFDEHHLARAACASRHCYIIRSDAYSPACAFGVTLLRPNVWSVWMFATDEFSLKIGHRVKRTFQQLIIPDLLDHGAVRAQCQSHADHHVAHSFILRMGGMLECNLPSYGSNGEDFVQFRWLREDMELMDRRQLTRPDH